MFTLYLYSNGSWFSTVRIYGVFGFTGENIKKIRKEITANEKYWQNPITWSLSFNNRLVTEIFLQQESECNHVF